MPVKSASPSADASCTDSNVVDAIVVVVGGVAELVEAGGIGGMTSATLVATLSGISAVDSVAA